MKKIILLCLLVIHTFSIYSQENEVNKTNKGEWIVSNYIGLATLENEGNFKVNGNIIGGMIGKEFILSNTFSLVTGIETLRVKSDFSNTGGQQLYLKNSYLKIPVGIRYRYTASEKTSFFIDGNLYGAYLYNSKIENEALNIKETEKDLGANFGIQAIIGLHHQLDEILSFNIGINTQSDLFTIYNNSVSDYKLKDLYAIQIGIGAKL